MGTKSNPGSFNCYAAALPDEIIFTTLARDPAMPATIGFWMGERARLGKNVDPEDLDRLLEAGRVAEDAKDWRERNLDPHGDGIPTWKLPRPEPGIDTVERPIRFQPASQYERARLDPLYALMPKIIVGLRQVAEEQRKVIAQTTWPNKRKDQMLTFVDRINGFAREIADAVGPGDFTVDFSGVNQTDDVEFNYANQDADERVVRAGDLSGDELEAIRTAEPSARSKSLDHLMEPSAEPQMLSRSRIEEFLDYATVYGDWDENTPNGETHKLSGEPMNDYRRVTIIVYKKVLGLLPGDYHLFTPENPAEALRAAAVEIGRETGREVDHGAFDRARDKLDEPAESDMVDLAAVPESEVPPHRFSYFYKFGRYAYARGLEIAPQHLPRALDAMTKDGWFLLSIFGATDSRHVGFIFERREEHRFDVVYPTFGQSGGQIIEHIREHVQQAKLLLQPAEDQAWIEQQLGSAYAPDCAIAIAMHAAIARGRMLQSTDLPATGEEALPCFLSTLPADTRVEVMITLLLSRGEACRRYVWSVMAAEHVPVDPLRLEGVPNDKLGRIAARLEAAYRDDCSSETGGCTGLGRQMEP